MIVRMTEGRRCTAAEEEARPCSGGAPNPCHGIAVVMGDRHGNVAALGCGCHSNVGVQAEGRGQELRAELFSGHFGMFDGSRFLPHGGSSARTGCRLADQIKEWINEKPLNREIRGLKRKASLRNQI